MKVLVTGVNGQLGHDLMLELAGRACFPIGSGSGDAYKGNDRVSAFPYLKMDTTDADETKRLLLKIRPDVVIHCSAWTAVDAAEDPENREKVFALNKTGTENLAISCRETGSKMIYISTDYVFNGQGSDPWKPDEKNYAPLNVYGESKLAGEMAVSSVLERYYIVRTAWVFGTNGNNFVRTMLKLSETHDTLRVVCDQIGTPTYTRDLARLLADMAASEKYGYYHATNEGGYISWYDFACEIFSQCGRKTKVVPVSTVEYGQSRAERPYNSRLDKSKLIQAGFDLLPDWRDALTRYLQETGVI